MANGVRLGQAFVEMSLKDSAFRKALMAVSARLRAVGGQMQRLGGIASAAGAAITAPFVASLKVFAGYGDTLDKMAGRTGFSVEALSQLGFAAEQSGKDLGTIERGAKGMARSLYALEQGSAGAVDAFDVLGLTMADLQGLSPDQQFTLIADRISQIEDPTRRAGVAMQVFGKAGTDLLPLFANGANGMSALREEANRLGLTMSGEDTTAAAAFTDALNRLMKQFRMVFMQLGAAIAGPLTQFLAITTPILSATIAWMQANRELLMMIAGVGAAIGAAGAAFVGLGTTLQVLGFAAAGLSGAIGVIGTALAAIISPIGLVVAGVAGGTAAFLAFTETGRSMVSSLMGWFGELAGTATRTFGAIASALAAGDIQAAGEVLWAGLKLLWLQGTASLRQTWNNLIGGVVEVWFSAWAGVQQLGNQVMTGIGNTWDRVVNGIVQLWYQAVAMVQKGWVWIKSLFDDSIDYGAEVAKINAELAAKSGAADSATNASISARNAASEQRLNEIGTELAQNLAGNDSVTQQAIAAAEQQLAEAKDAFASAEQAAIAAGEAAAVQQAAVEAADNTSEMIGPSSSLAGSQGTFSTAALASLQTPNTAVEKTAKYTERTAKATEEMARSMNGGMVFP